MHFLKTQLFQKAQLKKAEPNSENKILRQVVYEALLLFFFS